MTMTSFVFTEINDTMKYEGGVLYNLVFTEWRHCISQNKVWGRGSYITLFSPSDVTAFHRIQLFSPHIPTSWTARSKQSPLIGVLQSGHEEIHLQYWLSAQRWADGINMWPNAVGTFNRPLASVWVYRKFVWVLSGFIEMLIKNILKNLKTEKNKIMIWGIRYFITKIKTKIDVIPRSCFKTASPIFCKIQNVCLLGFWN